MAHYTFLDNTNTVIEVIVGKEEDDLDTLPNGFTNWEEYYLTKRPEAHNCLRTSYNTLENLHITGGTPFRGNYAGIGFIYNEDNDIFLPPKPYESWTLNTDQAKWEPPISEPDNVELYYWDEEQYQNDNTLGWVLLD
jgi:hypothetical protein